MAESTSSLAARGARAEWCAGTQAGKAARTLLQMRSTLTGRRSPGSQRREEGKMGADWSRIRSPGAYDDAAAGTRLSSKANAGNDDTHLRSSSLLAAMLSAHAGVISVSN